MIQYFLLGFLLLAVVSDLVAEPKPADSGAMKKAQGLIRQLSQEKTALEAEKQTWGSEKADLEAKIKTLEASVKKLSPLQLEVEQSRQELVTTKASLTQQLEQEKQQRLNLLQKHNDVVGKANAVHADNQLLVEAVKERESWISSCLAANESLRGLNQEILQKYRDKSFLQQVAELEPFTGLGAVDTEMQLEGYHFKLQQLKITPYQNKDSGAEPVTTVEPTSAGVEPKQ